MGFLDKIKEKLSGGSQAPSVPSQGGNRAMQAQNPEGIKGSDQDPPEETTVVR